MTTRWDEGFAFGCTPPGRASRAPTRKRAPPTSAPCSHPPMRSRWARLHDAYRATGADLPFGNPMAAHGVAMEGYFWRVTDRRTGRVLIALIGVNRDLLGAHWATVGLGAHPAPFLAVEAHPVATADRSRLAV